MHSFEKSTNHSLRRKLLGTASVLALVGLVQVPTEARAGDSSMADSDWHMTLDLVGQYTLNSGGRTIYGDPGFFAAPNPTVGIANGGDGYLALNLTKGDWVYGLSFNYGRTSTSHAGFSYSYPSFPYYYGSGNVRHTESHKIIDFTVGRDVGLGMLGMDGSSVFSLGVEWGNFAADTVGDFTYGSKYYYTNFRRTIHRRFNGIGPVISWSASTGIGDPAQHLSLNWGVTGSVLFGDRTVYGVNIDDAPRKSSGTVPRASGYIGIGWSSPDCPYAIGVGYAVQSSWGVFDGNFDDDGDESSFRINRLSHGPYIDLTLKLH